MKGAVFAKLYRMVIAATTVDFWAIDTKTDAFSIALRLLFDCFQFSIDIRQLDVNAELKQSTKGEEGLKKWLHHKGDIHAIPRQSACHAPNMET